MAWQIVVWSDLAHQSALSACPLTGCGPVGSEWTSRPKDKEHINPQGLAGYQEKSSGSVIRTQLEGELGLECSRKELSY